MKRIFLIIGILFYTSFAFANTATINGMSYSISFHEASSYIETSLVECYFTTYDGNRYSIPLYDYSEDIYYYSQELKKAGSSYKMDYILIVDGYPDDYGEIHLNLGSIDNNNNGIDDFCEKSLPFNNSVTGGWYSYDGSSGGLNGYLSRNANSNGGRYIFTANNTGFGNISLSGDFYVGTVSGTLNYSLKNERVSITYTTVFDSQSQPLTIETTYEILDENSVKINGNGIFPTTVFTRNGYIYSAIVELIDGEPNTFWADYQKWLIAIEDTNDSDEDGIPDLSDPPTGLKSKAMPWIPLLLQDN
jgi:hypothetical protein